MFLIAQLSVDWREISWRRWVRWGGSADLGWLTDMFASCLWANRSSAHGVALHHSVSTQFSSVPPVCPPWSTQLARSCAAHSKGTNGEEGSIQGLLGSTLKRGSMFSLPYSSDQNKSYGRAEGESVGEIITSPLEGGTARSHDKGRGYRKAWGQWHSHPSTLDIY